MSCRGLILLPLFWAGFGGFFVQAETSNCEHSATTFRCVKYLKNYDGDTITVAIPQVHPLLGDKIGVRVRGIDTPEIKGHGSCEKEQARTARRLAENLLEKATRIDLENVDRDKYFRVLADVRVDGRLLSEILLKNHLAVAYNGGTKGRVDWCKLAASRER